MHKKLHILLAEDEPAILRSLVSCISQLSNDYVIDAAVSNGVEALEKITDLKPDLVITDIRMPMLDGLELIASTKAVSPDTSFVILSGYAEFEYAKRAIDLGVTEYLLKPVDLDALEKTLQNIQKKNDDKTQETIHEFISQNLYSDAYHPEMQNPLLGSSLHLLFIFYGTVATNLYNELTIGQQIAQNSNYTHLQIRAAEQGITLFILRGSHFNEVVLAMIPDKDTASISKFAEKIYPEIISESVFTNFILSEKIMNGKDITEQVRSCYLYASLHIIFGQNNFFHYQPKELPQNITLVTPAIKELAHSLKPTLEPDHIKELCRILVNIWKTCCSTQFQVQTDLLFMLNKLSQKLGHYQNVSQYPSELLTASASYQELEQNMIIEFTHMCTPSHALPQQPKQAQQLAWKIRDYLDSNYMHPITYKDFNELFGYNEKYISNIFKEEYHISPNKYVTELRLTAAKNIMRSNPKALLKDIAQAIGYEDQLYFSRVFKNNEGLSPKAFQNTLLTIPNTDTKT